MWIIHQTVADSESPTATTRLINSHTDGEVVEFSPDTGKANVKKSVGEQLCEQFEAIVPAEGEAGDSDDEEASEDG